LKKKIISDIQRILLISKHQHENQAFGFVHNLETLIGIFAQTVWWALHEAPTEIIM
jgi:adenine deaminase